MTFLGTRISGKVPRQWLFNATDAKSSKKCETYKTSLYVYGLRMEAWRHDKHKPKMEGKISEQGRREWLWNAPDRLFVEMAKLAQTSLYVYGLHIEALPGIFKWVFVSSCYDITGFYDAAVLLLVLLSLSLPMLVMVGWSSLMWGLCTSGSCRRLPPLIRLLTVGARRRLPSGTCLHADSSRLWAQSLWYSVLDGSLQWAWRLPLRQALWGVAWCETWVILAQVRSS